MAVRRATPAHDDLASPSTARIYDYFLGGRENYQVDREMAKRVVHAVPDSPTAIRSNRAFLYRAVRFLAGEAGITQFLDIGSGLPTQLNVHEVAHSVNPEARIVYVDYDPLVRAFGNALMATTDTVSFTQRDLRDPAEVLSDRTVRELIDFDRPVAVLLIAMLQFVDDEEGPHRIVEQLRDALAPGSYITLSHVVNNERTRAVAEIQRRSNTVAWTPRSRAQILRFFDGLELVEPGLSIACRWRPDPDAPMLPVPEDLPILRNPDGTEQDIDWLLAGIGRKP
jgi:hypothetical protein